jgi:hypothetical protein
MWALTETVRSLARKQERDGSTLQWSPICQTSSRAELALAAELLIRLGAKR